MFTFTQQVPWSSTVPGKKCIGSTMSDVDFDGMIMRWVSIYKHSCVIVASEVLLDDWIYKMIN